MASSEAWNAWLVQWRGWAEAQKGKPSEMPKTFLQGAAGLGLGIVNRRDYGEGYSTRILIEPVFHTYVASPFEQLFIRASLHVGYVWQQPEMPRAIRIEERDVYGGLSFGLVWDWIVIPTLSGGPQLVMRKTQLKTSEPIQSRDDPISRTENLLGWFVQGGVGVPLFKGFLLFEPFYRYRWFSDDARESWGYGLETTVQLF